MTADAEYWEALRKAEDMVVECDCCSCYHPKDFWGDCRDDANRFASPEDYMERTMGIRSRE